VLEGDVNTQTPQNQGFNANTTFVITTEIVGLLLFLMPAAFFSITFVHAAPVDLGEQAVIAQSQGKLLMLVLVKEDCTACDNLLSVINNDQTSSRIHDQFYIVKSVVDEKFAVVCPEGVELSRDEFQNMKGISSYPAMVFTNSIGDVVYRYEGELTTKSLQALADFINQRAYAVGQSFEQWQRQRQSSL